MAIHRSGRRGVEVFEQEWECEGVGVYYMCSGRRDVGMRRNDGRGTAVGRGVSDTAEERE